MVDLSCQQKTKPNLKTNSGNSRQKRDVGNPTEAGVPPVTVVIMSNSAQSTIQAMKIAQDRLPALMNLTEKNKFKNKALLSGGEMCCEKKSYKRGQK